ncbi:hypothetical protein PybrP1_008608 [[Pythium] brassicae (nom. inval.)]|nr:hypothetical protein PybrP1_008608 [[Pythium] brassicae (nom. inval.)]
MDENTPLTAHTGKPMVARRRRLRTVVAAGLFAALVMYVAMVTWLSAPASQLQQPSGSALRSGASSRNAASGDQQITSPAHTKQQQQQDDDEENGRSARRSPLEPPMSTSASALLDDTPRSADDRTGGGSVESTNLLSQGAAHDSEDDDDAVLFVPGFGAPLEKQYAGLIKVNEDAVGKIFYWFFEARDPEVAANADTPLLIWLNGGPGASSMTGLLTEMGPYRITPEGKLIPHAQSWTQLGHLLFFDQPVGTGYSSVRDDSGYVNSQDELADQLYRALQGFFRRHPAYAASPVYVCGESYAGKYVPHVAHRIHERNAAPLTSLTGSADVAIRLVGMAVGNGKMWPVLQTRSVPDFAIALGLIDSQQYERANADISVCEEFHRQGRHVDAFEVCQSVTDSIYRSAGNPFIYDIRKTGNAFDELTTVLAQYFNSDAVRRALNVPPGTPWVSTDGASFGVSPRAPAIARHLLADEMLDVPIDTFRDLLDNYKFLFYAGNMDGSACNALGVGRMIDRLAWTGTVDYRAATRQPWVVDGRVAGLAKSSGNMSYPFAAS